MIEETSTNEQAQEVNEFVDGKSFIGITPFLTVVGIYLLGFWGGLIALLLEKDNSEIKYCASQAFVLGGLGIAASMILRTLRFIPFTGTISNAISWIIFIIGIICIVNFKKETRFSIPVVDDLTEKVLDFFTKK